ncbi:DNA gyrase inhibitor YacG [Rhodovulum sp. YNF3179]|uniref:DNA gyrase inhibitor YacG n=1 Tax=Rhodovulum sp. YNF3179 TaxID=3425127 RepID=UPI003D345C0A
MTCPICHKDTDPKYRPFCSKRCADVDLGKWLTGSYAVPADTPEDLDEAADEIVTESRKLH